MNEILELRRSGKSFASIKQQTGATRTDIIDAVANTDFRYGNTPPLTNGEIDAIIELAEKGLTFDDIQATTGATTLQIERVLPSTGEKKRGPSGRVITDAEIETVAELRRAGKTYHDMMEQTGLHRVLITECLRRAGFELARQGRRTISPEVKAEAIRLVGQGMHYKDVASKLGIHYLTVKKYVKDSKQ